MAAYSANFANFVSANPSSGWNSQIQSQPNQGLRQDAPPCIHVPFSRAAFSA